MWITPKPIFIIGAPRSGTSISTWALGQHPNIQPMPETAWLASLVVGAFLSFEKGSERGKFSHLSNVDYPLDEFMAEFGQSADTIVKNAFELRCRKLYGETYRETGLRIPTNPDNKNRHMQLMRSLEDPKQRWVDGTPLNSQFIWGLKLMFPEARFLHLLRAPEDVGASLLKFDTVGGIPLSPGDAIQNWYTHTQNAWLATKAYGTDQVLTVDYKTLIAEKEASYRRIFAFLGEAYCADSLLPYSERINSSQVDAQRTALIETIISHRDYAKAQALYARIHDEHVSANSDKAEQRLRSDFIAHSKNRALI